MASRLTDAEAAIAQNAQATLYAQQQENRIRELAEQQLLAQSHEEQELQRSLQALTTFHVGAQARFREALQGTEEAGQATVAAQERRIQEVQQQAQKAPPARAENEKLGGAINCE